MDLTIGIEPKKENLSGETSKKREQTSKNWQVYPRLS
jgi:hypothetical protein